MSFPSPAAAVKAKESVRRTMLARLRALSPAYIREQSARLRGALTPYLTGPKPLRICIYAPLPHEVNLLPLLTEYPLHLYHAPCCMPGHCLVFRSIHSSADLHPGKMGIPEPSSAAPLLPPEQVQLILVPGLAFTPDGKRLGYGGGYYDRFLPLCSCAQILAVALPEQMSENLPTTEFDVRIPRVLTFGAPACPCLMFSDRSR